ncbi:MAG: TolC family protein [Candidatus Saganbacteria bacterium]|nr:TolC family protein [Candidatus Saganbacteria bacterium]
MRKYLLVPFILILFMAQANAMDLDESINFAIKTNPTVIASQKKAAAAGAKLNQAISAFFPAVNVNGNLNQAYSSPQTVQITTAGVTQNVTFGTDATATGSGLQAQLSQPVLVTALFPELGIAKKGADSATQQYQQTVIDTSFNVTQAYFGVLKSIKMEKLMSDSLDMATAHRKQVQSMMNAGLARRADFLQSKVMEADDNVSLIQSKYDIELSKDSFNNVLGNDMKQPVDVKDEGFTGKADGLQDYDTLLKAAYDNRPDWKMYQLATGISEDQVRLSQTDYLPSIVLSANSGNQLTQFPTFQSNVNSWKVMGSGSWNIFDSFARENRVKEAFENLAAQKANVDQFKNNIAMEVHGSYLNLKSALDIVIATKQAVDSAEESYQVSNSLYNSGLGTNVDVLDAQVSLTQAWTDHLNALFNVEIAKAKINKAVGKKML